MNAVAMQSFGFGEQLVRAVDRAGVAWFVGNDVCACLEIANTSHALGRLESDERDEVAIADLIGREQRTTIISESGVYGLVFTSRKPAAKQFRRWVTGEVLPALRTRGEYRLPERGAIEPCRDPELPDEFEAIRTKLALAKEARIVFGLRAAREAWRSLGLLPQLTDRVAEPDTIGFAPAIMAALNRSVLDWLEQRCVAAPGHRERTQRLHMDYLDWAKSHDLTSEEIQSLSSFGAALSKCGIGKIRSDGMCRIGLKLVA